MLDARAAFARNKNKHLDPKSQVARVKDDFLPGGEASPSQGVPGPAGDRSEGIEVHDLCGSLK